jgi:hypothetical protein
LWDGAPAIRPKKPTVVRWPDRPKRTKLNSSGDELDVLVNKGALMRIDRRTGCSMLALCGGLAVMVPACTQTPGDATAFDEGCNGDCEVGTMGDPGRDEATTGSKPDPAGPNDDDDDDETGRTDGGDSPDDDDDRDDGPGTSDPELTCCEAEEQICLDGGETSSVCGSIRDMCETDACEQLMDVCDPTTVPVSHGCARAYYACFGFRVNKCRRTNYDQCMSALGDADTCAAWDASCASRETYCEEQVCPTRRESTCWLEYECTDWGHAFDPCWEEYLTCTDAETCEEALLLCIHADDGGEIYDAWSCNDGGHGDPDDPDDPDDPVDPPG